MVLNRRGDISLPANLFKRGLRSLNTCESEVILKYMKGNCFQQDPVKTGIFFPVVNLFFLFITQLGYVITPASHQIAPSDLPCGGQSLPRVGGFAGGINLGLFSCWERREVGGSPASGSFRNPA